MKKTIALLFIIGLMSGITTAQNSICSKYYPLKENVRYEMTHYNGKDKVQSTVSYLVKDADDSGALIVADFVDTKGNAINHMEYRIDCANDGVSIDFKSLGNNNIMEQYKDAEVELTGTNIELPNNLSVNQTLPDANMNLKIDMGPLNMTMYIDITNRKVQGNETITTPAGSFECVVISHEVDLKMGISRKSFFKEWFAEGVGLVKSEEYNKRGKVVSKSVMTKFSN